MGGGLVVDEWPNGRGGFLVELQKINPKKAQARAAV